MDFFIGKKYNRVEFIIMSDAACTMSVGEYNRMIMDEKKYSQRIK